MKKAYLILVLLSLVFSFAFKKSAINTFPLFGKTLVLDVGHGGVDPGSTYKGEYEKNYNLLFAQTLKTELEKRGGAVILTRDADYDLSIPNTSHRKKSDFDNRIKLIENISPDLYISLHMNYLNTSSYYGSQVFYSTINDKNKNIAQILQKNLNKYFNFNKEIKVIDNDKYMYKKIKSPGVLIEYAFISSPIDRKNINSENYRTELSEIIVLSLLEYFT